MINPIVIIRGGAKIAFSEASGIILCHHPLPAKNQMACLYMPFNFSACSFVTLLGVDNTYFVVYIICNKVKNNKCQEIDEKSKTDL